MNFKERLTLSVFLVLIAGTVLFDLVTDTRSGVAAWHAVIEGATAMLALAGLGYLLRGALDLRARLNKEIRDFSAFKDQAAVWRAESKAHLGGLSKAIDAQLSEWKLSEAERDVAFLLLKGLSLKEVADIRGTTEKTARVQSMAIYSKSGLSGRSQLSAFFLEDLLPPSQIGNLISPTRY